MLSAPMTDTRPCLLKVLDPYIFFCECSLCLYSRVLFLFRTLLHRYITNYNLDNIINNISSYITNNSFMLSIILCMYANKLLLKY